jgi:hypothetical protein
MEITQVIALRGAIEVSILIIGFVAQKAVLNQNKTKQQAHTSLMGQRQSQD